MWANKLSAFVFPEAVQKNLLFSPQNNGHFFPPLHVDQISLSKSHLTQKGEEKIAMQLGVHITVRLKKT